MKVAIEQRATGEKQRRETRKAGATIFFILWKREKARGEIWTFTVNRSSNHVVVEQVCHHLERCHQSTAQQCLKSHLQLSIQPSSRPPPHWESAPCEEHEAKWQAGTH
ncbi:uncharacterized protein LOC144040095 [Vanacampus margaritifer]